MSDSLLVILGEKVEQYATMLDEKMMEIAPDVYQTLLTQWIIESWWWSSVFCIVFIATLSIAIFGWKRLVKTDEDFYGFIASISSLLAIGFFCALSLNVFNLIIGYYNPHWAVWQMLKG